MGKKPKNKPAGSPRGFDFYLNKISLVVFTVLAVVFVYTAISTQMLTPLLIAALAVVVALPVALVWWLSLRRSKPVRLAIGSILAMVFCLVFAVGTRYIQIGIDTLNTITKEEDETSSMAVYVRADDTREMEQLLGETFGTLALSTGNTQAAVTQLNQEYSTTLTTQSFNAATELVDARFGFEIPVFVTALIWGYIVQFFMVKTHAARYIDKGTVSRISGTATDYLIVSAIGSIDPKVVMTYGVPIIATTTVAFVGNWLWFVFVGGHTSPRNWFERNMIVWGQACGVLATGILLTRIVDPDMKSYALEDTGFANLIMRAPIIFLTAFPPIMIGLWPEIGSVVLGWGCTLATAIILIVGWKMKVFTPGGKLPKGALYKAKKG